MAELTSNLIENYILANGGELTLYASREEVIRKMPVEQFLIYDEQAKSQLKGSNFDELRQKAAELLANPRLVESEKKFIDARAELRGYEVGFSARANLTDSEEKKWRGLEMRCRDVRRGYEAEVESEIEKLMPSARKIEKEFVREIYLVSRDEVAKQEAQLKEREDDKVRPPSIDLANLPRTAAVFR